MKFRTTILTFNPPSNSSSIVVEVVSNNEMEFSIMSQSFSSGHSKVLALLQLINMKNYNSTLMVLLPFYFGWMQNY